MLTDFSVLAQAQLVLVLFQVLAVDWVVLEVDSRVDSLLVEGLPVDHALLLVTSAVAQITLLEIVRLHGIPRLDWKLTQISRSSTGHEVLCLR